MLNVDFTAKIGFYYNEGQIIWMCAANCAGWAEIVYNEDGSKTLVGFVLDKEHMKRMLKNQDVYKNSDSFTFYTDQLIREDAWNIIRQLAKAGKHISLEMSTPF